MELRSILNALMKNGVSEAILELAKWIAEKELFGFIEKVEPIMYCGKEGLLYWDYILWNELTFVDLETKSKLSLYTSVSDKLTQERFDELVKQYGTEGVKQKKDIL